MVEIFKALSEESRLRILSLLMEQEMCVCEIETCLEMSQSNASRHLTALKKCGILESYKKAQWAYYRINETFIKEHELLWEYLQCNMKSLDTYQRDQEKSKGCIGMNICGTKQNPH